MKLGRMYARDLELVFPSASGPQHVANLRPEFKKMFREAGVGQASMYWLRHTVATQLLAAGENPKVVAERLGHTSMKQVLDTYGHVLEGM
jgi:integrase